MEETPLLSIIILSCNQRKYQDLLQITFNSLFPHLIYPRWELIIYSHSKGIEEGYVNLMESARGEYIFNCQDDFFFFPAHKDSVNWIQTSIQILNENPDIEFVRLEQDDDGQSGVRYKNPINGGWRVITSGFTLRPTIARAETIRKMMKIVKETKFVEGLSFERRMNKVAGQLGFSSAAKLRLHGKWNRNGVCVHTGYTRRQKRN